VGVGRRAQWRPRCYPAAFPRHLGANR
ncbi:hypothetical protein BN1708_018578, partial [Verticillium longisporum]